MRRKAASRSRGGGLSATSGRAARRDCSGLPSRCSQTWAMLIKRVYEIDPLTCPKCGGADEGGRVHRAAARRRDREDSASLRPVASLDAAPAAGAYSPSPFGRGAGVRATMPRLASSTGWTGRMSTRRRISSRSPRTIRPTLTSTLSRSTSTSRPSDFLRRRVGPWTECAYHGICPRQAVGWAA